MELPTNGMSTFVVHHYDGASINRRVVSLATRPKRSRPTPWIITSTFRAGDSSTVARVEYGWSMIGLISAR